MVKMTTGRHHATANRAPQRPVNAVIAVVLIVVGLGVLVSPVVITGINNYSAAQAAKKYSQSDQAAPQETVDHAWDEAHRYNLERADDGQIMDAWNDHADENSQAYQEYLGQLPGSAAMGRIIIPAINSDLPIYHGTSEAALAHGVGHLYGTDLPVGGQERHSVLTAHTGLPRSTMWDNLVDLNEGDAFYIHVAGQQLKYQIDQITVVLPHETDELHRAEGQDYVTLITCTPYGINTHRLLVRGHRVALDPADTSVFDTGARIPWQWWMTAVLALALLIVICLLLWVMYIFRSRRPSRPTNPYSATPSTL